MPDPTPESHTPDDDFAAMAARKSPSAVGQFVGFLRNNRKWWLLPLVATLLLVAALLLLSSTAAAPFIYTLF